MLFDFEKDRENGYRPGVMILFCNYSPVVGNSVLLGRRRSAWTRMHSVMHNQPHDAPNWMLSYEVPQGGIEAGESCEDAIRREINEELGNYDRQGCGWCANMDTPEFLFRDQSSFPLKKDGRTWKGKALYAFRVRACIPDAVSDWLDDGDSLPTPGFPGGVKFYTVPDAIKLIQETQRGPKGDQLVRLVKLAA